MQSRAFWILSAALAFAANLTAVPSRAQARLVPSEPDKDFYQRSEAIMEFKKAATSGPDRGQEIFYYKCWMCHNEYTKEAPSLIGLFQRSTLVSGDPLTDETVRNQIRNGSANMAAYKYALNDADINDLMSYLKEKCCWNSDAPPLNPRYIAK